MLLYLFSILYTYQLISEKEEEEEIIKQFF
jgi:hypothetical protein